jgi:hypothetical protein
MVARLSALRVPDAAKVLDSVAENREAICSARSYILETCFKLIENGVTAWTSSSRAGASASADQGRCTVSQAISDCLAKHAEIQVHLREELPGGFFVNQYVATKEDIVVDGTTVLRIGEVVQVTGKSRAHPRTMIKVKPDCNQAELEVAAAKVHLRTGLNVGSTARILKENAEDNHSMAREGTKGLYGKIIEKDVVNKQYVARFHTDKKATYKAGWLGFLVPPTGVPKPPPSNITVITETFRKLSTIVDRTTDMLKHPVDHTAMVKKNIDEMAVLISNGKRTAHALATSIGMKVGSKRRKNQKEQVSDDEVAGPAQPRVKKARGNQEGVHAWRTACAQARQKLGLIGNGPIRKGTPEYVEAKKIIEGPGVY